MSFDTNPPAVGSSGIVFGIVCLDAAFDDWARLLAASGIPKACLVVGSRPGGCHVQLEVFRSSPGIEGWLVEWLRRRLENCEDAALEEIDFTFLYVLLGEISHCDPDGSVDGTAVLESGIGGYHRGPSDGVPCSGVELYAAAIASLEAIAPG